MKTKMMMSLLKGKMACENAVKKFFREEKGASTIVEIIVVIVIIIAVAAIFREQLMGAVTKVFDKLTDFIG